MAREVGVGLRSMPRTLIKPSFCRSKQSNDILHWTRWNEVKWKTIMISDSQYICSFSKYKSWDDEDCTACLSYSYDKDMLWKCAHILLYCTSKYLHGCIQFSASAAIVENIFLQIMKIIVWIVAFVLINIIIQLAELPYHGLSLKNVWITFWFLQNQLFWGLRTWWQSLLWLYRILWLWEWRICSFSLKSSRRGQILIY